MLQVRHRQHQRGRRVGARDGGHDPARLRERRTGAAMLARHDLGDQPRAMQPREVLVRKAAVSVVAGRVGGQLVQRLLSHLGITADEACILPSLIARIPQRLQKPRTGLLHRPGQLRLQDADNGDVSAAGGEKDGEEQRREKGDTRLTLVAGRDLVSEAHLPDGIHPDDDGHRVMAEALGPVLAEAIQ